jgi:hypothetical protein
MAGTAGGDFRMDGHAPSVQALGAISEPSKWTASSAPAAGIKAVVEIPETTFAML